MAADWESLLSAALRYAVLGFPIFPVYEPAKGECSCPEGPACKDPAKHPRTKHGFKDATTDETRIREWWRRWPEANIGMPTGTPSGIDGLDVDPRRGGDKTLTDILTEHGPLPETPFSDTGGGGQHIFFSAQEAHHRKTRSDP
jgi:hypothetical protein